MNPSVHLDVREALTKEVEHRSIKTGKGNTIANRNGSRKTTKEASLHTATSPD
jgi:hypothetical protein